MTSLIVATFLGAALYAVLTAAGLQFIGLGDPNSQSWGTMLYWAQNNEALLAGMPLWAIAPGVCVALLGAAFALLNYAFDEISSPALRVRKLDRARLPKIEPSRDRRAASAGVDAGGAQGREPDRRVRHRRRPGRRRRPRRSRARPRRVPGDRRRVGLREVDAAVRDRAAARRADGRGDRRWAGPLPGPRSRPARGEGAPRRPLARPLRRDAERDERAQPGADRRRADARRVPRPLELVEGGDRSSLARGSAARLHRPGAPAQLSAPALGRDAAARDDRDGAALHARPRDHGRADLGARRRRAALADGADQGAAAGARIRRDLRDARHVARAATSRTGCW